MDIRPATRDDVPAIMKIYAVARRFMRNTGNLIQWTGGYPPEELITESIRNGNHYVCICDGRSAGTFYFAIEDDITYEKIYDGMWLSDKPYGVVHRLASSGEYKGIGDFCLKWCFGRCGNIRVDTHRDNIVMQNILNKNGFSQCGVIFVRDGTERLAFQKCENNK